MKLSILGLSNDAGFAMKWTLILGGLFAFGYFVVPLLFRAMKQSDYDQLYHGMQKARADSGVYQEGKRRYTSYEDKLIFGGVRK